MFRLEDRHPGSVCQFQPRAMWTALAVCFCVVCVARGQQQQTTVNVTSAPDLNYTHVSCAFHTNSCGWSDVGGSDNNRTWSWYTLSNSNPYMTVDMSHARPNDTGRMASPWLNPKPGSRCELTFQYYMYADNYCQLSVIQKTDTPPAETTLWETRNKSGANFSDPQTVNVTCEQNTYRIIFEGRQIETSGCNEIRVDNINFTWTPAESTSTTSATLSTTSAGDATTLVVSEASALSTASSGRRESTENNENPPHTGPQTDSNGGLGAGFIAAIVIVVVAVFLAIVAVGIFLVRLHKRPDGDTELQHFKQADPETRPTSAFAGVSLAFNNDGYTQQELSAVSQAPCVTSAEDEGRNKDHTAPGDPESGCDDRNGQVTLPHPDGASAGTGTSHNDTSHNYNTSHNNDTSHNYNTSHNYTQLSLKDSEADSSHDNYDHLQVQPGEPHHKAAEDEQAGCDPEQKADPKPVSVTTSVNAYEDVDGLNGPEENPAEAGKHSTDQRIPEECRPNQQTEDCSRHADVANATSSAAEAAAAAAADVTAGSTTGYETVNDDGKLVTSSSAPSGDVYDRLNARGGPAVGQEVHQNHHDHFNGPAGTGAEYSSLGLEERTRDLQREMAEGDYSHI